ncbi:MAG: FKBP-type peptidyl-prolyl cis-trans isomerase [Prevotellaceae bacterium]|jgi:FKBP-type peptidyl-prolyl cis-trans isomerase|nr:FKBP-type peptidyl-prolyl cis-trans isomerase [Prevotellaceae bacterium]
MKKTFFVIIIATLCISSVDAQRKPRINKPVEPPLKHFLQTQNDSVSYSYGVNLGNELERMLKSFPGMEINKDMMLRGIRQSLENDTVPMTAEFANQYFQQYIMNVQQKEAEQHKAEGRKFLDENKKRPQVQVTPSGLQYEVITQTEGPKPTAADKVKVHYTGRLTNGTVFDSSVERGEPITFPLNGVIKGWTEGLQLMSSGAKYKFYIPYDLAYGERGAGQAVPPFATLIFDVELLEINPEEQAR